MIDKIIQRLKDKAKVGHEEILAGDVFRHQVPHAVFSSIVLESFEDNVLEEMVRSGEWQCGLSGFSLKSLDLSEITDGPEITMQAVAHVVDRL